MPDNEETPRTEGAKPAKDQEDTTTTLVDAKFEPGDIVFVHQEGRVVNKGPYEVVKEDPPGSVDYWLKEGRISWRRKSTLSICGTTPKMADPDGEYEWEEAESQRRR